MNRITELERLTTDTRLALARQHFVSRGRFNWQQIEWIIRAGGDRLNGNVLIFGTGHDVPMWSKICKATFLEDNAKRYRRLFAVPENQGIRAYLITYGTSVKNWEEELQQKTINTLPLEIERAKYDVIIVDGPRGGRPNHPGRVSSILHSCQLIAEGGVVFVDDINRTLEREVTLSVMGQPGSVHSSRTLLGCWKKDN